MSSVPLKDVCLAIDKRNKKFYNSLDPEQQNHILNVIEKYLLVCNR